MEKLETPRARVFEEGSWVMAAQVSGREGWGWDLGNGVESRGFKFTGQWTR